MIGAFQELVGSIDCVSSNLISGWAAVRRGDTYFLADVEVTLDGNFIARISPSEFRRDLIDAGIGSGCFAFDIPGVFPVLDGSVVVLSGTDGEGSIQSESQNVFIGSENQFVSSDPAKAAGQSPSQWLQIDSADEPEGKETSKTLRSFTMAGISSLVFKVSDFDRDQLQEAKKIAIYVTYTASGNFFFHQKNQVAQLKKGGFFVIAVHATKNPNASWLNGVLGDVDIFKANIGYDFGSWWVGAKWLFFNLKEDCSYLQNLVLMNDSSFGSFASDAIEDLINVPVDLTGVCESLEQTRHVQSFFLAFKGPLLWSGAVLDILLSYDFPSDKKEVIQRGELMVSRELLNRSASFHVIATYAQLLDGWISSLPDRVMREQRLTGDCFGLRSNASIDAVDKRFLDVLTLLKSGAKLNPSHFFAGGILKSPAKLFKRELLLLNPANVPDYYSCCFDAMKCGAISVEEIEYFVAVEEINSVAPALLKALNRF